MSESLFISKEGSIFDNGKAMIHINAPLGSTIQISKDNIIVKTFSSSASFTNNDGETADYYYAVSSNYGVYTITATKDSDTISDTVEVSTNQQYDVKLLFRLVLFDSVLHSDYVGINTTLTKTNGANTIKFNNGYISPQVDVTKYKTLKFYAVSGSGSFLMTGLRPVPVTSYPGYGTEDWTIVVGGASSSDQVKIGEEMNLNIANLSGLYYFQSTVYNGQITYSYIILDTAVAPYYNK